MLFAWWLLRSPVAYNVYPSQKWKTESINRLNSSMCKDCKTKTFSGLCLSSSVVSQIMKKCAHVPHHIDFGAFWLVNFQCIVTFYWFQPIYWLIGSWWCHFPGLPLVNVIDQSETNKVMTSFRVIDGFWLLRSIGQCYCLCLNNSIVLSAWDDFAKIKVGAFPLW